MPDLTPMSLEEAEAAVLEFEDRVKSQVRHLSPESFAVEVARRFRLGQVDKTASSQHPPHFLVHALEANCAYFQPWTFRPLTDNDFANTINLWHDFNDPVLMWTLKSGTHLFEFVQYMHRTQMELQGEGSHCRFGRAMRMFGDPSEIPRAAAAFAARYGLSTREWIKLLLVVHARTGEARMKRLPPPGIRRQELQFVVDLGIPLKSLDGFLREAARPWAEIGASYRRIRDAGKADRRFGPLTWSQRRPILAKYPIMHMARGYLVPAPPLLLRNIGDGLFDRFDAIDNEDVRTDLTRQFERYVEDMIRAHLPKIRLIGASGLERRDGQSCDFALDLHDVVLLIECKAVMLDRDLVSERAVINSAAIQRLLDGYLQIVRTAERIRNGDYSAELLARDKPIVGLVVTLGNVPGADNDAVQDATKKRFQKESVSQEAISCLSHRPQPFDAEAFEYLVLLLQRGLIKTTDLFAGKLAANPWHVGDWQTYLNARIQEYKPFNLAFWREPFMTLLSEMEASR